jgi:hypothetical protein
MNCTKSQKAEIHAMHSASETYLTACRNTPASEDKMSNITFKGIMNFTNSQQSAGPSSGNCLINSLINNEQEVGHPLPAPSLLTHMQGQFACLPLPCYGFDKLFLGPQA